MDALAFAFEVMDKEIGALGIIIIFTSFGVIGFLAGLWRRWAAFAVLTLALLFTANLIVELRDPFVGPAIRRETGWDYVAALLYGCMFAFAVPVVAVWLKARKKQRSLHG